MTFFTKESEQFWRSLAKNNSKAWFDDHRKEYEAHLKEPYQRLAEALVEQVKEVEPEYQISARDATYRINRDIRFAKDKTPYKTELGITIGRSQKHDHNWPGYTMRVGPDRVAVAGGLYMPGAGLRDHVRRYVGEHAAELKRLERGNTKFAKTFGALGGEAHKRAPAELRDLAEVEPRVLNTQWVFWADFHDPKLFTSPKLDQFILDRWEAAHPIQEFLKDAARSWG